MKSNRLFLRRRTRGLLFATLLFLLSSCTIGYHEDESFESDVKNATLESPQLENVKVELDATGENATIEWPVVHGAEGYEFSWYVVDDPENPIAVVEGEFIDGCSVELEVEEDTKYKFLIKTIGNKQFNNKDAEKACEISFSTLLETYASIPSGVDLTQWFIDNPLPETDMEPNEDGTLKELAYELEANGEYTISGPIDFGARKVTIRGNKIKAVFDARMKDGKRCSGSIPYGYNRLPNDKQTLVVDPVASEVVKRIFLLANEGKSPRTIAELLTEEKVLIPAAYAKKYHPEQYNGTKFSNPYLWGTSSVRTILGRQEYLGHTVLRKSVSTNFKLHKRKETDEDEQYVFQNTHEPIISQELWDSVQKRRCRVNRASAWGTHTNRLSGYLYCADCGRRLTLQTHYSKKDGSTQYSYRCGGHASRVNGCTAHSISADNVEALILASVKRFSRFVLKDEETFALELQSLWKEKREEKPKQNQSELKRCQKRYDELSALIRSLYENLMAGLLPERQYQRLMAQYDDEQTVCEARIAELKKELDNAETTKVDLKRFIKLIRKYKDCDTLTDEMLYELVEKVVIHSASGGRTIYRQQQIDIYFNFIGDTFPSQIEISRGDKKNLTEQQLAKRKKYQKTAGENRKKKRAALREAAKTDSQAAAEYEALLQKGRERCRKYAQNKKLAQQEPADTVPIQFEPSEEMKGESA